MASEQEGLDELPGGGGCLQKERLRGAASQHIRAFSQSTTSMMRSNEHKLQKFGLGVKAVFSSEKSRLPREAVEFGHGGSSEPDWAKLCLDCHRYG